MKDTQKKVIKRILILLVLLAILCFLINRVDKKPSKSSNQGARTYISDESFFADEKYTRYSSDSITDDTAQYICDLSQEIIDSANSETNTFPAEYKDMIDESIYTDLDLRTQFYSLNDLESENSSQAENAEETYEINMVSISLSKDKCVVDYEFAYVLRDKTSGKVYSSASNFESGPLCRLYFEKQNDKWRVTNFYMPV